MVRVSGTFTKASNPIVASIATPPIHELDGSLSLRDIGADLQSTVNRIEASKTTIGNADRPSNVWFRLNGQSTYWYQYAWMDWIKSEVSILSTLGLKFTSELLRYDFELRPKFIKKCMNCGYESQTLIDQCPVCRGTVFRHPDHSQKKYFINPLSGKSFIDDANRNHQSLKEVIWGFTESEFFNNQAYLVCITGDTYDKETGARDRSFPLEFMSYDPKFVKYLYDETGLPGKLYGFTMEDRSSLINLNEAPDVVNYKTKDGKDIYPAAWQIGSNYGGTGKYWLYTDDEVYQDHWFRPAITYGIPIWYDIEDDLLAYHYIEKHNLKKYKFGYVRKVLILPGFNDEDVEAITKGIQDILAKNDNSIPIICTPPQLANVAEMHAQALELGTESSSDLIQVKNEIRDRVCAHGGMPNIFVGDVEASGGMNNESQQITVLDRYLLGPYNNLDRLCRWIMHWFEDSITDWELVVRRPSKAYTDVRRRIERTQEAQLMSALDYEQQYMFGEFWYSEEPVRQIERKRQAMMAQTQMPRGLLPGDGEGPPEKGTARREDEEIGATKDEIDLSKREAEDAMAM